MRIIICGSMSSSSLMLEIGNKLIESGFEVTLPKHTKEFAEKVLKQEDSRESTKNKIEQDLIRDYYEKIKKSDALLVVNIDKNGVKNYIGGNAFLEMGFAHCLNKKIFLLNDIPKMTYKDEILAIKPIVLNGDFSLLC